MTESKIVEISEKALKQVKHILTESAENKGKGLRLSVIGGGCSGLSYKIDFGEKKEKDNILNFDGVEVYIDPKSSIYLSGVVLDYQDGLNGKGFVFENPNAKNTCGCGESFSI